MQKKERQWIMRGERNKLACAIDGGCLLCASAVALQVGTNNISNRDSIEAL